MLALPDRTMTPEEFHAWHQRQEGKFELEDGRVTPRFGWLEDRDGRLTMMAGANGPHDRVARNVLFSLMRQLAGGGRETFGSDMAIRTGPGTIRYPEASVVCDREELEAIDETTYALTRPRLVVEVLSRSTERNDRTVKLLEYQALPSLRAAVLIHPGKRWMVAYERTGEREWRSVHLIAGATLTLTDPAIVLTPENVFGAGSPPKETRAECGASP